MPSWNEQANSIFLAAVDLPRDAWAEFLDHNCESTELRAHVEGLLEAHLRAQIALPTIPPEPNRRLGKTELKRTTDFSGRDSKPSEPHAHPIRASGDFSESEEPQIVGKYRLISLLGEGGMGAVYLAQTDLPVKRTVALKVIRPGFPSSDVIARFESERRALALMDHPGIARVLDAGETRQGLPYFVMELVNGLPLTDYCDQHKLTLHDRLVLFRDVCQAVQHAHQKGILHRDLKPSNILVASYDDRPVVKVIDFGLAKALETSELENPGLTLAGGIMGTPQYMSPEQADTHSRDIDTRTDIYSLGVILYELLTGTTPLAINKSSLLELLRRLREEDPLPPSSRLAQSRETVNDVSERRQLTPNRLIKTVRGELEWTVLKATDKDRERRYETAGQLAEEITRYLTSQPVQAGPPSRRYRFAKFARRNRTLLTAGAVTLVCLILGLVGSSIGMFRASIAERRALESEASERRQRTLAEQAYGAERAALLRSESVVAELLESRGDLALREDSPALAALWFANSAGLPGKSDEDRLANLIQTKNALQDSILPVATIRTGEVASRLRFSPSGRFVASQAGGTVSVWDWSTITPVDCTTGESTGRCFDWHPQRDMIAIADSSGKVRVWNVDVGTVEQETNLGTTATALRFSPDGGRLAMGTNDIHLWDWKRQRLPATKISLGQSAKDMSWSPSADKLAVLLDNHRCVLVKESQQVAEPIAVAHQPSTDFAPIWYTDTSLFVVQYDPISSRIKVAKVDVGSTPPKPMDEILLGSEQCFDMTLSDDRQALAIGAYRAVFVLDANDLSAVPETYPFTNQARSVRFCEGNHEFVAAGRNGEAILVKRRFGLATVARLPHFGIVEGVDVHPDQIHFGTLQSDGALTVWRDARVMPIVERLDRWG
ncbi:MAG: protein kinase, partial [Planctomycetales bacterium]|nr:protein kinase [Planctomycetales bacterium]